MAQIVSWILSMASCQAWGPICKRTNYKLKRSDRSDLENNCSQRGENCHPRATDEGRPSNIGSKQLSGSKLDTNTSAMNTHTKENDIGDMGSNGDSLLPTLYWRRHVLRWLREHNTLVLNHGINVLTRNHRQTIACILVMCWKCITRERRERAEMNFVAPTQITWPVTQLLDSPTIVMESKHKRSDPALYQHCVWVHYFSATPAAPKHAARSSRVYKHCWNRVVLSSRCIS